MKTTMITGLATILLLAISCKKESSLITGKNSTAAIITDVNDPGKYASVYIHGQRWMATNLAVTRYRNGDKIPQVRGKAAWAALTTGAWCWYNDDSATGASYGRLYNWYAVNDPRGLAPTGWHVPSDAEWDTLKTHLGSNAGGKLKDTGTIEAGTGLWLAPNTGATNSTGFTGFPGGLRNHHGVFYYIGSLGYWWSSTEYITGYAWYRGLDFARGTIAKAYDGRERFGFSVRCLRD